MIDIIFNYLNEIVEVRINGTDCLFKTQQAGGIFVPIESINIDKVGSLKEHPDLKDNPGWKKITIKRFKSKLASYETEMERIKYIISDLGKYGYVPIYFQQAGHRPVKIKQGDGGD